MSIGVPLSKLTNTIYFEISAKGWVQDLEEQLTDFISVISVAFTPIFAITFLVILADFLLHFPVFFLE